MLGTNSSFFSNVTSAVNGIFAEANRSSLRIRLMVPKVKKPSIMSHKSAKFFVKSHKALNVPKMK